MNSWNLRTRTLWNPGESCEPNTIIWTFEQVRLVNLWGCKYFYNMIQGGWSFFTFRNKVQSSHPCYWGKPLDLKPNSMPTGRFTLILQRLGSGRGLRLLLSFGGKWVVHLSFLRWQWSTRRLFHLLLPQFCWDRPALGFRLLGGEASQDVVSLWTGWKSTGCF